MVVRGVLMCCHRDMYDVLEIKYNSHIFAVGFPGLQLQRAIFNVKKTALQRLCGFLPAVKQTLSLSDTSAQT